MRLSLSKLSQIVLPAMIAITASQAMARGAFDFPRLPKFPQPEVPAAPAPVCATLWVDNFSNAGANIAPETNWQNLHSGLYARRSWHGGLNPHWSGKDRAWSDISSAEVKPGCTLFVHSGENIDGEQRKLPEGRWDASVFPFSDNVGSVACSCVPVIEIDRGGFDFLRSLQSVQPANFN